MPRQVDRVPSKRHGATSSRPARLCVIAAMAALSVAGCKESSSVRTTKCATETRADAYVAGLEKTGTQKSMRVRLLESKPGPPIKGDNEWRVQILDPKGGPISGAALTVTPLMPDHRHGTAIKAVVQEQGGGEYRVAPINLFMPGFWTITFALKHQDGALDQAVFSFCVDG